MKDMYHDYMEQGFCSSLNLVLNHHINSVGHKKSIYFASIKVHVSIEWISNLNQDVVSQEASLIDSMVVCLFMESFGNNNFSFLNILLRHRMLAMYLHEVLMESVKIYFFLRY